jgi:molybdopterin synthase sulfur carrier subunit
VIKIFIKLPQLLSQLRRTLQDLYFGTLRNVVDSVNPGSPVGRISGHPLAATAPPSYNFNVGTAAPAIRVKVLFFGRLKEIVGRAEDSADVAEGALIEELFARYAAGQPVLARFRASVVASCNQEFAAWSTPLHSGDEVAFLPPVSGG